MIFSKIYDPGGRSILSFIILQIFYSCGVTKEYFVDNSDIEVSRPQWPNKRLKELLQFIELGFLVL